MTNQNVEMLEFGFMGLEMVFARRLKDEHLAVVACYLLLTSSVLPFLFLANL